MTSLPIDRRHVHVEQTHQAIRFVLDPRGAPRGGPVHTPPDADDREVRLPRQHLTPHPGDLLEETRKPELVPDDLPILRHEDDKSGRDELLQRPPALVPARVPEGRVRRIEDAVAGDVLEVRKTYLRTGVPTKHRVDGLGELRAAALVDAAGVHPQPFALVFLKSDSARVLNFGPA